MTDEMEIEPKELTKEQQRQFLSHFEIHGIMGRAARECGFQPHVIKRWLETDEDFAKLYADSKEMADDDMRHKMWERGMHGWEEPVVYQGQIQMRPVTDENGAPVQVDLPNGQKATVMEPVTITKFDNKLLSKEIEARKPEIYKKRVDITTNDKPLKTYVNFPMEDV